MFHKYFALFCVIMILLTACGTVTIPPTAVSTTVQPTSTPKVIATPNIYLLAYELINQYGNFEIVTTEEGVQQAVFTNGPTFNLVDGTLVEIAQIKQDEHELIPRFVVSFDTIHKGVRIKGDLITDESLLSEANISLPDNAYAELVAEAIFTAWWNNGVETKADVPTEEDRVQYMALWAKAQKSNDPVDWKKVQFTAWANDLNNGDGYKQEEFTFWPMHDGETPDGVRNISKLSIAVVSTEAIKQVDMIDGDYDISAGMNMDGDELFFYTGTYNDTVDFWPKNIARRLSTLIYWLGRSNTNFSNNPSIYISMPMVNYLLSNGLLTGVLQN